tara:strand:+ start:382 stop:1068 length:687 start_codon:yes stop_codon:yes gene_type:complete
MINFSIVIPIYNEALNIQNLVEEIFDNLKNLKNNYELILIDDASTDNTFDKISALKKKYDIIYQKNNKNNGQSFSIKEGVAVSRYDTIVTMDGDGQNNPKDIIKLLNIYGNKNEFFLVSGIRLKRKDNLIKIISSKIANKVRSIILKDNCKDTGCSLKVFDKKSFLDLPYFNSIHRFIPSLFEARKLKVKYIYVDHRPRINGNSKYGTFDRLIRGIVDLYKVYKIINK